MHICILGGAGTIGATTAYTIALTNPDWQLSLIDPAHTSATGHAQDIETALAHATHPVGTHALPAITQTARPRITTYSSLSDLATAYTTTDRDSRTNTVATSDMDGTSAGSERTDVPSQTPPASSPDVFVVAASAPRPEGAASRGERQSFLTHNREIIDEIANGLNAFSPAPVIVVSNPVDQLTYRLWRQTSEAWTRDRFLGYSLSETARTAWVIAARREVSPTAVTCHVIGEHGENIVPVFSRARIHGERVEFTTEDQAAIRDRVRDLPYEIIRQRGEAETSRWVTAQGAALLARTLALGGVDTPVCLSTPLAGTYGYHDVALSVPVTLTTDGIKEIYEWDLSSAEHNQLDTAYEAVVSDINSSSSGD